MTDKTCKGCRFWEPSGGRLKRSMGLGRCSYAVMFWDATEWRDEGDGYDRFPLPKYENQKVFVQDGSDYMAHMYTRPDHFCGEFQPKEVV